MLGAVFHPEFFTYADAEVLPLSTTLTVGMRYLYPTYLLPIIPLGKSELSINKEDILHETFQKLLSIPEMLDLIQNSSTQIRKH